MRGYLGQTMMESYPWRKVHPWTNTSYGTDPSKLVTRIRDTYITLQQIWPKCGELKEQFRLCRSSADTPSLPLSSEFCQVKMEKNSACMPFRTDFTKISLWLPNTHTHTHTHTHTQLLLLSGARIQNWHWGPWVNFYQYINLGLKDSWKVEDFEYSPPRSRASCVCHSEQLHMCFYVGHWFIWGIWL